MALSTESPSNEMQLNSNGQQPSSNKVKTISQQRGTEDLQVIIRSAYRQVLGNAHVMENQRLTSAESRLLNGDLTVREFIREIALSPLYRSLFFETSSPYRFVELNFKHFLGRAPQDQTEIAEHVEIYNSQGYEAEVNSYLNSDEYISHFGEDEVPSIRGYQTQTGLKNVVFNRTSMLNGGYAANNIGKNAKLITSVASNLPPKNKAMSRSASAISRVNTSLPSSEGPKTLKDVHSAPYAEDLSAMIRAAYRQVLGNAHVMESQRLICAETRVRNGEFKVREFVRAIALSDLYRSLFFETSSSYRFIELNFKHLLGRAPQDQTEIAEHVHIYNTQGYEAEINSYIDSDEYIHSFGENEVPTARGNKTQTGIKNVVYNRTSTLIRGFAANDIGKQAKLTSDVAGNLPTKVIPSKSRGGAVSSTSKRFQIITSKTTAAMSQSSRRPYTVTYSQLSQAIQRLHKSGAKVLNIIEAN